VCGLASNKGEWRQKFTARTKALKGWVNFPLHPFSLQIKQKIKTKRTN